MTTTTQKPARKKSAIRLIKLFQRPISECKLTPHAEKTAERRFVLASRVIGGIQANIESDPTYEREIASLNGQLDKTARKIGRLKGDKLKEFYKKQRTGR